MARHKKGFISRDEASKAGHGSSTKSKYRYVIKLGWFKTGRIRLNEALINEVVLRVNLIDCVKFKKLQDEPPQQSVKTLNVSRADQRKKRISHEQSESESPKNGFTNSNNNLVKQTAKRSDRTHMFFPSVKRYYLQFCARKYLVPNTLTCSLDELIKMLTATELPVEFKVVVTMNNNAVKSVRITNNKTPEKCAIFGAGLPYKILINDVPVRLLGCPRTLEASKDIQTLVRIINTISVGDCMVLCV